VFTNCAKESLPAHSGSSKATTSQSILSTLQFYLTTLVRHIFSLYLRLNLVHLKASWELQKQVVWAGRSCLLPGRQCRPCLFHSCDIIETLCTVRTPHLPSLFQAWWLLYVTPCFTFRMSIFAHSMFNTYI